MAAAGLISLALVISVAGPALAVTQRIVPATGPYKASDSGDPSNYEVRAQVKRSGGRRTIAIQIQDSCGGFATSTHIPIGRNSKGMPNFSVQIGAASIGGRWTSGTTVSGTVKTPCARKQAYVMRKAA